MGREGDTCDASIEAFGGAGHAIGYAKHTKAKPRGHAASTAPWATPLGLRLVSL